MLRRLNHAKIIMLQLTLENANEYYITRPLHCHPVSIMNAMRGDIHQLHSSQVEKEKRRGKHINKQKSSKGKRAFFSPQEIVLHIDKSSSSTFFAYFADEDFGLLIKTFDGGRGGFAKRHCFS